MELNKPVVMLLNYLRKKKSVTTFQEFLKSDLDLGILIQIIEENNCFDCLDFIKMEHKKVFDFLELYSDNKIIEAISFLVNKSEHEIIEMDANLVLKFIKWLNSQVEIINILMGSLEVSNKTQDDLILENIVGDKLSKFSVYNVYKGVSKNIIDWEFIGKLPFELIFTYQLMNKTEVEINNDYQSYLNTKNKS